MEIGVFIPIGSNGWLVSTTSPQYKPSFELNKQTTLNAERYGLDFVLSILLMSIVVGWVNERLSCTSSVIACMTILNPRSLLAWSPISLIAAY